MSKPAKDFQSTFGFTQELTKTTQTSITRIRISSTRNALVAAACGAVLVVIGLETFAESNYYQRFGRVYVCNWRMMWKTQRLQAIQRFMSEEKAPQGGNPYYHKHLVARLADLCVRVEARKDRSWNEREAWDTLATICDFYNVNEKTTHLHEGVHLSVAALVRLAEINQKPLSWASVWSVFNLLMQHDQDKVQTMYFLQRCLELPGAVTCDPPPALLPPVLASIHSPDSIEMQAAKDLLTLLLLKRPSSLSATPKPSLQIATSQDQFLVTYWPHR